VASNSTQLNVREGSAPAANEQSAPQASAQQASTQQASAQQASVQQGGVSAVAQQDNNSASVKLDIEGVGAVQQWIRNGSVGQSIAISSDGQSVRNRMQIDLVRQTLANNGSLNQNVAQAMSLVRGVGRGPGQ
jgi:anti-sigma28 factor (negative regulator of flagellin synthesis)